MKNFIVRITTGFSENQQFNIGIEEAHKAYFLFRNPEKRGVFDNGIALIGRDIRTIQPDWHASMGWNPTHKLDDDDWNEINAKVKDELKTLMEKANDVSYLIEGNPALMATTLSEAIKLLPDKSYQNNHIGALTAGINKLDK